MTTPAVPDQAHQFTNVMLDADNGASSYGLGFQNFFVYTEAGVDYDLDRASAAYAALKDFAATLTGPTPYMMRSEQVVLEDSAATVVYGTTRVYGWQAIDDVLVGWGMIAPPPA